jgi:hypothetical protein
MPLLPTILALAAMSADSLELKKIRYEEPQLRAEVDSGPPAVQACPREQYPLTGWTRRSAGIEGISYATPPGYPRPGPYGGATTVLSFYSGRNNGLGVSWSKRPELGSSGYWVDWHATKHDYSWCRERVDGRAMLIVTYKVTTRGMNTAGIERSYFVNAVWPLRPGVWLVFFGQAPSPTLQREQLAVIRSFRVEPYAASQQLTFSSDDWMWHGIRFLGMRWFWQVGVKPDLGRCGLRTQSPCTLLRAPGPYFAPGRS